MEGLCRRPFATQAGADLGRGFGCWLRVGCALCPGFALAPRFGRWSGNTLTFVCFDSTWIVGSLLAALRTAPHPLDLRPVLIPVQPRPVWSTHLGQPGLVEVLAFLWSKELLPQLRPVLPGLLGLELRQRPFCIRIEPEGLRIEEL